MENCNQGMYQCLRLLHSPLLESKGAPCPARMKVVDTPILWVQWFTEKKLLDWSLIHENFLGCETVNVLGLTGE